MGTRENEVNKHNLRLGAKEILLAVNMIEIEVRSTRNQVKNVIFKLLETFIKSKVNNKSNEIVYKSLN